MIQPIVTVPVDPGLFSNYVVTDDVSSPELEGIFNGRLYQLPKCVSNNVPSLFWPTHSYLFVDNSLIVCLIRV